MAAEPSPGSPGSWPRLQLVAEGIQFIVKVFWAAAPGLGGAMLALTVLNGLLPALSVWLSKQVVDLVAARAVTPGVERSVLILGLLYMGVQVVASLLTPVLGIINGLVNERLLSQTNTLVMRKANSFPDLSRFEEARYYDDLQRISREAGYLPMNLLSHLMTLLQTSVASAGLLLLIGRFHPLLPAALLLTAVPELIARDRIWRLNWDTEQELAAVRRRLAYWGGLGTGAAAAKEIRLFGLAGWLRERYRETFGRLDQRLWAVRRAAALRLSACGLIRFAGAAGLLFYLVRGGLAGRLTPGDLVLYIGAAFYLDRSLSSFSTSVTASRA